MRFNLVLIFFTLAFTSCYSQRLNSQENLTKFSNDNRMGWNLDGTIIEDKFFQLYIPATFKREIKTFAGEAFLHIFEFDKEQKIVVIYNPYSKSEYPIEELKMSFKNFKKVCEDEKLFEIMKTRVAFKRHRYFSIKKVAGTGFYIMYLNVSKQNVYRYNSSIHSLDFD